MLLTIFATSLFPIIGGPSVGKTSIINELHKEGHVICKESATDVILEMQSKGISNPWDMCGFEIIIFDEKLKREEKAFKEAIELGKSSIYIDRGLLDQVVYLETLNKLDSYDCEYIMNEIKKIDPKTRYKAIFYVEPYQGENFELSKVSLNEKGEKLEVRREDTKEALILSKKLKEVYEKTGLPIYTVPAKMSPKERAEFILKKTNEIIEKDKNAS
jgi:predicted ATPase